jgi:tetratricopeptide (TPR) repeat protein
MIIDNADNLKLFGVGRQARTEGEDEHHDQNLHEYIPCAPQGTVLWTSRDGHIVGTLVGARRGIEVQHMAMDEAMDLLARIRDIPSTAAGDSGEAGVDALLKELQYLPLVISQAGAYMRRLSKTAEEYLRLLKQGNTRWEVLMVSDTDRHRRPEVSNSVLETWRISTNQIQAESEMSYHILHVIAYVDNQDIPQELLAAAAHTIKNKDDQSSTRQISELEVLEAVARLKELSFLSLRQTDDGGRSYEMHKLVQEAIRYGLTMSSLAETTTDESFNGLKDMQAFYSGIALQVVRGLILSSMGPTSWAKFEKYITHALRVGEWAELSSTEVKTATLLEVVWSFFLERGRYRELGPVAERVLGLRRDVLEEKHPDILRGMENVAVTYRNQGLYIEAESISQEVLNLRREVLGNTDTATIRTIENLAVIKYFQGQYDQASKLEETILQLRSEVLGEKHRDTIRARTSLVSTYLEQDRQKEAHRIAVKALALAREELDEKDPLTMQCMSSLATIYYKQELYKESKELVQKALKLQQEVLGEKHPETIGTMSILGDIYGRQGQLEEGEEILLRALEFGRELFGEKHRITVGIMALLAPTYYSQGRHNEAEQLLRTVLSLQQQTLGESHPNTILVMDILDLTQKALQRRTPLWENIRRKVGKLRISRSPRGKGF